MASHTTNAARTEQNDEARAARNAYAREWRKKNPDKVKAAASRYWAKRAAEQKEAGSYADDADNS